MTSPIVQSNFGVFPSDGVTKNYSVTLTNPVTNGNGILVGLAYERTSVTGVPQLTVCDSEPTGINGYISAFGVITGSSSPSYGFEWFYCPQAKTTANFTVTGRGPNPGSITMWVAEVNNQTQLLTVDESQQLSGTGTSATSDPFDLNTDPSLIIAGITRPIASTITCAPASGFTSLYNSTGDSTHQALSIAIKLGFTDQDTTGFTFGSSSSYRGQAISMYYTDLPSAPTIVEPVAVTTISGAALRYTVADMTNFNGNTVNVLREHSGGVPAYVFNGSYNSTGGVPTVVVSSGNIQIDYSGAIGTVAIFAQAASTIWSADDTGHSSTGAAKLVASSGNTSSQIITTSGGTDGQVTDGGTNITNMPCGEGYVVTFTSDKTARLTINGTVFTTTFTGTPSVAAAFEIFGQFASGKPGNGSGNLHDFAIFATPQTPAQEQAALSAMADTAVGARITKRVGMVNHDATSQFALAESSDGIAFDQPGGYISFANVANSSGTRDAKYAGTDGTYFYWFYTCNNFTQIGTTFGIMRTAGDFRLFTPCGFIDCSSMGNGIGTTNSPWGPTPVFDASGNLVGVVLGLSNTERGFYATISGTLPNITLGTFTEVTNTDDYVGQLTYPNGLGNPSATTYRGYGAGGKYHTAIALTGPYTGSTNLPSGGLAGEDQFLLQLGSTLYYYADTYQPGDTWLAWPSTDNGATFTGPISVTGLESPLQLQQGSPVDRKALGLWTAAAPSSRLSLSLGLSL